MTKIVIGFIYYFDDETLGKEHECLVGTFYIKQESGKSHMKLVPAELFEIS